METDRKKLTVDNLHGMSHSELKKVAKLHGIKGNMKASKIIAALSLLDSDDMTGFSTPAQQEINSSKKKKEDKFNEDKNTPLATPRRGTYSIDESPVPVKLEDSFAAITFDAPIFDTSNVTVSRGSERKLRPRKVSFMSPLRTSSTPKNPSIKRRPKTPVASHAPICEQDSFSSPVVQEKENMAQNSKGNTESHISKETSAKIQRTVTPNFKKIHEQAFNKMESIVDYQKRKVKNSAKKIGQWQSLKHKATQFKSKIPAYAGIPFISGIQNSAMTSLDLDSKPATDKKKAKDCQKKLAKFDLKASLSRKLSYKPYTGPLKPLAESNYSIQGLTREPPPVNQVVQQKRFQNRSALKGVRTNKRFELQMKNRKLD